MKFYKFQSEIVLSWLIPLLKETECLIRCCGRDHAFDAAVALTFKNVVAFQNALQGQPVGNQGTHVQSAFGDKPDQAVTVHGIHPAGLENEVLPYIRCKGRLWSSAYMATTATQAWGRAIFQAV